MPEFSVNGPGCVAYGPCLISGAYPNTYFSYTNLETWGTVYTPVPTLALLCSGDAGIGIQTQIVVAGAVDTYQAPAKNALVKFKASPSAAAACDKVKGLFPNTPGTAGANPNGKAKALVAAPVSQLACNVTFKATATTANKVGVLE